MVLFGDTDISDESLRITASRYCQQPLSVALFFSFRHSRAQSIALILTMCAFHPPERGEARREHQDAQGECGGSGR